MHLGEWPDEDRRSRIIFITRGVRSEEPLASLEAFRSIVGAGPRLLKANAPVKPHLGFLCYSPGQKSNPKSRKGDAKIMDIGVIAQILSSLVTFVAAAGILYQGREARKARDDQDRPQIIVDADYTERFTTDIVVRNIGHGMAKNITFEFSAPVETTSGEDITELPYFKHRINFMAPQTDIAAVWDSYKNVVQNSRAKGLTEGITITSSYEDRNG
jgi:hypothetical protein